MNKYKWTDRLGQRLFFKQNDKAGDRRNYIVNGSYRYISFPLRLNIGLTNACNLDCIMCSRRLMKRPVGSMKQETFQRIIDEGSEKGLQRVGLGLIGEPLLHKNLVEFVSYAHGKGVESKITTNALLLDESLTRRLLEAGLSSIHFSVDGATKETYERIRRKSNFERVVNNIETFIRLASEKSENPPFVELQIIRMHETVGEVKDFVAKWANLLEGVPHSNSLVKDCDTWAGQVKNRDAWKGLTSRASFRLPCFQLAHTLSIYWDGTVSACCVAVDNEIDVGHLAQETLEEIWQGKRLRQVKNIHERGDFGKLPFCLHCDGIRKYPLRKLWKSLQEKRICS